MGYEIIQINENTWRIEDGMVRFFLLAGTKEALLIDSGMEVHNAKEIAEGLTKLPVKLLITHADMDHVGSNDEFDNFYMHPSEASNYYNTKQRNGDFTPVEDGDVLNLGDRPLEIIHLPGHTPGSIAVLDVNNRVLISGDPIQDGSIFMFGVQREIHAYAKSLEKLQTKMDRFDCIYPSHGTIPVKPQMIDELLVASKRLMAGEYSYNEINLWGNPVKEYRTEVATFLMQ